MVLSKISFVDLKASNQKLKPQLMSAMERVLDSGYYVLGPEVEKFERMFADYCGAKHAISVGSGTDALILALQVAGIGPGDEVITVSQSFFSTAAAIVQVGAIPVFVDVNEDLNLDLNLLEKAITTKTKAVLPVHFAGRPVEMKKLMEMAKEYDLKVIEDAAQAVGTALHGQRVGTFGHLGCFSLHPLKNLSALGDGGVLTTDDESVKDRLIQLRNNGLKDRDHCEFVSRNSRLDAMQAALLQEKLKGLDALIDQRRENAAFYQKHLPSTVKTFPEAGAAIHSYHLFVILTEARDALKQHLSDADIETKIHYPVPIHFQNPYKEFVRFDLPVTEKLSRQMLSLPIHENLTKQDLERVCHTIEGFQSH